MQIERRCFIFVFGEMTWDKNDISHNQWLHIPGIVPWWNLMPWLLPLISIQYPTLSHHFWNQTKPLALRINPGLRYHHASPGFQLISGLLSMLFSARQPEWSLENAIPFRKCNSWQSLSQNPPLMSLRGLPMGYKSVGSRVPVTFLTLSPLCCPGLLHSNPTGFWLLLKYASDASAPCLHT